MEGIQFTGASRSSATISRNSGGIATDCCRQVGTGLAMLPGTSCRLGTSACVTSVRARV